MRGDDVIADATALVAALDRSHERHGAVQRVLDQLLDDVVDDSLAIVVHTDALTAATSTLRGIGVSDALVRVARLAGAFDVEPLHDDLLRDARWVVETAAGHGVDLALETALTIELARRRGTRRVLSLDPLLHLFDLERLLDGQFDDPADPRGDGQSRPA